MNKTCIYRHFAGDGALLYVGMATNPTLRMVGHKATAHWFTEITRIEIEWFADRAAAILAEEMAISRERPLHNVQYHPNTALHIRRVPTARHPEIIAMYGDGYSCREVGACFGISHQAVLNILRKNGVEPRMTGQRAA